MNTKQRRAIARANRTLGRKDLASDMCRICGFVATEIIAARAQDFKLPTGELIELHMNKRLEPPLGVRFPKSAAKRHPCLECAGTGRLKCDACQGSGHSILTQFEEQPCPKCQGAGKLACEKCAGTGHTWSKDDYAPLCMLCSQFLMAWLAERERLSQTKLGQSRKILLPNQGQVGALKQILRP